MFVRADLLSHMNFFACGLVCMSRATGSFFLEQEYDICYAPDEAHAAFFLGKQAVKN